MNSTSGPPSNSSTWKEPLDETTLMSQLNALLDSLHIPIPLVSPTDLTPRLLIAILESLIGMRIPVIERQDNTQVSKVQNMKVFLGVLETDILQEDVGLSQLDPRRLANGEWEEVVVVARLLCWIGWRMELIPKDKARSPAKPSSRLNVHKTPERHPVTNSAASYLDPAKFPRSAPTAHPQRLSPKSQLELDAASVFQSRSTTWDTSSSHRDISPFTNHLLDDESCTTFETDDYPLLQPPFQLDTLHNEETDSTLSSIQDILGSLPQFPELDRHETPHCIHEVQAPSFLLSHDDILPSTPPRTSSPGANWCPEHSTDACTCDLSISPIQVPPVRYGGYIEAVDEDTEIASFEFDRSMSRSSGFTNTTTSRVLLPLGSQIQNH